MRPKLAAGFFFPNGRSRQRWGRVISNRQWTNRNMIGINNSGDLEQALLMRLISENCPRRRIGETIPSYVYTIIRILIGHITLFRSGNDSRSCQRMPRKSIRQFAQRPRKNKDVILGERRTLEALYAVVGRVFRPMRNPLDIDVSELAGQELS